ncbi:MAG TPA: hypothetical protein DCL86_13855, partial [Bacteroidales bacterium]|nr:hypothetical protein [Bacteroidales bacterium]
MKPATWLSRLYLMIFVGLSSALFGLSTTVAQKQVRVEPPFWWVGMHESQLQLLVYGENIAQSKVQLDYPGVSLIGITRVDNPNYLFIDLALKPDIQHGKFTLNFLIDKKLKYHYTYELRQREPESAFRKGFDQSDVLYLLMPDRFANGNPLNDNHPEMIEKANRLNPSGRHGGDIQGINDHLDYFNELGVTTLWINPLLENNHPEFSYHGYAITDFYRIDPRFGSNADYVDLVDAAHKKGLKIVMDMILNHCG